MDFLVPYVTVVLGETLQTLLKPALFQLLWNRFKMMMSDLWVSCTVMSKNNHGRVGTVMLSWIIHAKQLLPLSSDYISKMLLGLNLHLIQEGLPIERAIRLPSPHAHFFEKHTQAPTHPPGQSQNPHWAFSYLHPHPCPTVVHRYKQALLDTQQRMQGVDGLPRIVNVPPGSERHLRKDRVVWEESKFHEQIEWSELSPQIILYFNVKKDKLEVSFF